MVYYNRILRMWVVDPVDIFLLTAIIGSITASYLKDYLSEKKAMERLKKSLVKKSKLETNKPLLNSREMRLKKIYRVALGHRGGQYTELEYELTNDSLKLAQEIKNMVERLAIFLKERELKGIARIFFKNGRLLLELILYKCRIDLSYVVLTEGLSTQVIVLTATAGGAAGFILSWFSAGTALVAPPVLISVLLVRSVVQQIQNQADFLKFKKLIKNLLDDEELKETVRAFFMEGDIPTSTTGIEMKPFDVETNPLPEFEVDADQTLEEFIKARMKDELGLVENPTSEQIEEMIHARKIKKPKGKTVYFKDFVDTLAEAEDDIIDAEIIQKEVEKIRIKNKEL